MKKVAIITFSILFIDIITKLIVTKYLILNTKISVIRNFFYLTYTHNYGAAWSIFHGQRFLLITMSLIIILGMIYYLVRKNNHSKLEIIGFSLLVGGALGNLIDRVIYGYIIDFLDFYIFNYYFPIFNIADSCIVVGVFILAIDIYIKDKKVINIKE